MSERWNIDRGVGASGPRRRRTRAFGPYMPPRLDDRVRQALETGRVRMFVAGLFLALAFALVAGRATELAVAGESGAHRSLAHRTADSSLRKRADIVDRNGEVLATDLPTASLYANARRLLDPREAARGLVTVLPDLDYDKTLEKLQSDRTFVWLRRNLTPREQVEVTALGIPGLDFIPEYSRVYPHGPLLSHVLGYVDSDNTGIAGLEKRFDEPLTGSDAALQLTIDLRVQHVLREELRSAMLEFKAKAAAGVVMDVRNGEVVALVSLPDFDPNHPGKARDAARFNRATLGVYELGSTFKVFTAAMALDSGVANMRGRYDARQPLHVARFTIRDYHAKHIFIEHRSGAHCAGHRRQAAAGLPAAAWHAGPAAAGDPRDGPADRAFAVAGSQHDDRRLRPRARGQPAASRVGRCRRGQWRRRPRAYAYPGAGRRREAGPARVLRDDIAAASQADAADGAQRYRRQRGSARISGWRQDRNGRKAGAQGVCRVRAAVVVCRRVSDHRAALRRAGGAG